MVALVDLTGAHFGMWQVLRRSSEQRKGRGVLWWARCDCGTERSVAGGNLRSGISTNCGCRRNDTRYVIDLLGRKFGTWTVIARGPAGKCGDSARWLCRCDCGLERQVMSGNLQGGSSTNCGCGRTWEHVTIPPGDIREFQWRFDTYVSGAHRRNHVFELTLEQFVAIASGDCRYCGAPPAMPARKSRTHAATVRMNGIDRVDNSVGYVLSNCVPCCAWCNEMKRHRPQDAFLAHVRRIAEHNAK